MMIARFYTALLRLYPRQFRTEFGNEMQDVLAQTMKDATERGLWAMMIVYLRELRDLPGSVLQEHLRARRRKMPSNGFLDEKPLQRSELLAAMIIFLLPLISILTITDVNPLQWMDYALLVLFWGTIIFAIGHAISRRIPRWSLPYLGFISMVGIILIGPDRFWSWIYPYFIESFGSRAVWPLSIRIIYVGIFDFIMMFMILLGALVLVNFFRLLPYTRGVWGRIRADWTQLSFMLYGGLVFGIMLLFDEYHHEELWKFMAWLCLALGAWFYLRVKSQKRRILALLSGATGAMWIVALAKWALIPLQKWPTGYPISPSETTRWVETGSAMLGWVWILFMLLAPALLKFLPQAPDPITPKKEEPVTA
jgi:hypothetical protein